MRSQNQYTIYALNDVVTDTAAPDNPYLGQLWVDTSLSPPVTKVWNGSAWKEQNGTDTLKSNITTLTTKTSKLETSLDGLTSTVSSLTTKVNDQGDTLETVSSDISTLKQTATSLESRISSNESNISTLTQTATSLTARVSANEGNISTLTQTTTELSATVDGKVDETYGSSSSSFGWSLKSDGFYVYSNAKTVATITSSGLSVVGAIDATSGSIGNLTIDGYLYFGGNTSYYISANYNDSNYYINLPGFRVDKASTAVFSGKLSAPSGTIGGFTISTSKLYATKTAYNDSNTGVYIGTDGIGLGAGTFYVTSAGKLYATDAEISGTINASSGTIGGFTIGESSLTNSGGGSYIQITSGSYTTKFAANAISSYYTVSGSFRGWFVSHEQIAISAYYSSKYAGIKITPTYTKRTSSSKYTSTTVAEGCITSYSAQKYNAETSSTTGNVVPFIIGMYREYAKSPYTPSKEWGAYVRFANYQTAELVYDSAYSGKWQLRNVSGSTYDLVTLISWLSTHKYYVWTVTSSMTTDDTVKSCLSSTHGFSKVLGAVVTTRYTGDLNGTSYNAVWDVYISGTTVYVGNDTGDAKSGFICIIFGY